MKQFNCGDVVTGLRVDRAERGRRGSLGRDRRSRPRGARHAARFPPRASTRSGTRSPKSPPRFRTRPRERRRVRGRSLQQPCTARDPTLARVPSRRCSTSRRSARRRRRSASPHFPAPRATASRTRSAAPQTFVPVEPPTLRPVRSRTRRIVAIEAASGTWIILSMTSGRKRRLDPLPTDPLDPGRPPREPHRVAGPRRVEDRVLRIDDAHQRRMAPEPRNRPIVALVPPVPAADDDPRRNRMALPRHLAKDRLGDVVVAAPVRRPLGEGELVEEVAAGLVRESLRLLINGRRVIDQTACPALRLDQSDLLGTRRRRHHGHERAAQGTARSTPPRRRSTRSTPPRSSSAR